MGGKTLNGTRKITKVGEETAFKTPQTFGKEADRARRQTGQVGSKESCSKVRRVDRCQRPLHAGSYTVREGGFIRIPHSFEEPEIAAYQC